MDCFNLFMFDTLIRLIVSSTNIYINLIKYQFQRGRYEYVQQNCNVISSYIYTPKVFQFLVARCLQENLINISSDLCG